MNWQPRWRREGKEPDYRFSLANERTFLAWIRTALALLAGGVLLVQFATRLSPRGIVTAIAFGLASLAALLCSMAYLRWRANEIAMRHDLPLPVTGGIPLMAGALTVAAGTLGAVLLLSAWRIGFSNAFFSSPNTPRRALEHAPTRLLGPAAAR